ncbi:MAG: FecR domain-containing protein [candidate division WS1 bacterium]|jgi:ferric-dicitrate binding protein FerR (iron transport regulator)|nr:FecR domain-containing protein [candidate division WS1 bacterium]
MLSFLRRKQKPQTEEEMLAQAFEQVGSKQKHRAGRKRRRFLWRKYADPRILIVLAVIGLVLVINGVIAENSEFYATVAELTGAGTVTLARGEAQQPLELEQRIEDGGEVKTGPNCWVSLDFPDGSVITLAPASEFVVELVEYNRGGMWRGRSFTLNAGHMWARVSEKFGEDSRCRVHTPSSVAAVRGTRFYMFYDPNRSETSVCCNDGAVRVDGFRGRGTTVAGGGSTSVGYGGPPGGIAGMDNATRQSFGMSAMNRAVEPDPWLKRVSMKITSVLDLPLSILGIGKSSWAVGAADFARRNAAMEAMRRIHTSIEGYPTYPDFVDPFTLKELDFSEEDALQVLKNFDGRCLVSYERSGQGFVMYARARDKARTPFKLTAYGVEPASEEEVPAF